MPESWLCQKVEEIDDRLQRTELILDRLGMGAGATANFHGTTFEVSEYQIAQWVAGTPLPLTDASSYVRLHSGGLEIRGGRLDIQTAASGARMEMTGSSMITYDSSDNETFKLDFTNGNVTIAGTFTTDVVTIDNSGVTIETVDDFSTTRALRFINSSDAVYGTVFAKYVPGTPAGWTGILGYLANVNNYAFLNAESSATYYSESYMYAKSGTSYARLSVQADSDSSWVTTIALTAATTGFWANSVNGVTIYGETGHTTYIGDLKPYRNSTTYTGYVFVPLTTPLTSTSWDGDSKGTGDDGTIDLSAVFGAPAGIKAVLIRRRMEDATVGTEWTAGPSASSTADIIRAQVTNVYVESNAVIPCDANGDIYCTFSGTIDDCIMQIHGYWI